MSDRVLSTETAMQAARSMQSVLNGPLAEQIEFLIQQGQTLSDPTVWDGRLAIKFRDEWPEKREELGQALAEIEVLQVKIKAISESILQAGGNV